MSSANDFRAESLPKPTRKVEDFGIDLSGIMGSILEVDIDNLPKYEWNWGLESEDEIDEKNSDATDAKPDNNESKPK